MPTSATSDPFAEELVTLQPQLLRNAMRLTKNSVAAQDLRSDTNVRALQHRHQFAEGTNLGAWTAFIMRNLFLTSLRRTKWDGGSIDDLHFSLMPWRPASQEAVLDLADTLKAAELMQPIYREALLLVGGGATYEEAAEELCCSIGTVKSRVCRARDQLAEALA